MKKINDKRIIKGFIENFYCFSCGYKLEELGFGILNCSNCENQFIPYIDKDEYQCMCLGVNLSVVNNLKINKIEEIVCNITLIHSNAFRMKYCKKEIVQAKQLICFFAKKYKLGSLSEIGDYIGLDHSTVSYSINKINKLLKNNEDMMILVENIDSNINFKSIKN